MRNTVEYIESKVNAYANTPVKQKASVYERIKAEYDQDRFWIREEKRLKALNRFKKEMRYELLAYSHCCQAAGKLTQEDEHCCFQCPLFQAVEAGIVTGDVQRRTWGMCAFHPDCKSYDLMTEEIEDVKTWRKLLFE